MLNAPATLGQPAAQRVGRRIIHGTIELNPAHPSAIDRPTHRGRPRRPPTVIRRPARPDSPEWVRATTPSTRYDTHDLLDLDRIPAMTYRIGLMGCGVVASYGHLPAIRDTPELQLHALFDPNPDALRREADAHNVEHAFTDPEAFFQSGLDAVIVTSPAPAHLQNVLDAARHGLPVLCEKPLSMTPDEGQQMIDAMDAKGLMLAVAFCYRYSPCALEIKRLVEDGAIGDLRTLRLIYNWDCHGKYYRPDPDNKPDEWTIDPKREGRMLEGGPMVDCGTHQIDLAQWWTGGAVTRFQGHGSWVDDYQAPDHVWLHMDHDNGAHTMVETSFSFGHTTRDKISLFLYELIGTAGVIRYDRNVGLFELRNDQYTRQLPYHEEKNFHGMYHAFADALRTGTYGTLCPAPTALRTTHLARTATDQVIAQRATPSALPEPPCRY